MIIRVTIVACIIILAGCSNDLTLEEFQDWMKDEENGLHVTTLSGDFIYDVQYQPTEYVVANRVRFGHENKNYTDVKNETAALHYILLKVGINNTSSDFFILQNETSEMRKQRQYYFSYNFQDDITLLEGTQVLPCVLFQFERIPGGKSYRIFSLAFENDKNSSTGELTLQIQSPWLNGVPVRIKIHRKSIPSIKINK